MKHTVPLATLLLASQIQAGDFIRQIQTVNGTQVIYQIDITGDSGQVTSKPLNGGTATFQLYTSAPTLTKLDEKTVGTYAPMPVVTTQILSEDPYVPARTRVDRPYGLKVTVSGLVSTPNASDAMKKVQMIRSYQLYDSVSYGPLATRGDYADITTFSTNNTFTSSGIYSRIPVTSPVTKTTRVLGAETFTVRTWPVSGSNQSQLSAATIQIWPVAEASITGIETNKKYRTVPKLGSVTLRDLYPRSTTWAQVYKGSVTNGATAAPLPATAVAYNTYSPQNAMIALTDLEDAMKDSSGDLKDGIYTVEIVTTTPFDNGAAERLASVTFELDQTIRINGSVNSAE